MKLQKRPVVSRKTFKDRVFFWKGIPVAITAQLAEFYECEEHNITRNFNNNKERFKVKDHYFRLVGRQVVDFIQLSNVS